MNRTQTENRIMMLLDMRQMAIETKAMYQARIDRHTKEIITLEKRRLQNDV